MAHHITSTQLLKYQLQAPVLFYLLVLLWLGEVLAMTGGGAGYDRGYSLVQTSDAGYALTGYTYSYVAGGTDMFLAKYTSDGTLSWSRTWGGTDYEYGRSLVQTSDGGYAVTGTTASYGAGDGYYDM